MYMYAYYLNYGYRNMYSTEQLRLCFFDLVRYFLVLDIHLWKLILLNSVLPEEFHLLGLMFSRFAIILFTLSNART